MFGRFLLALLVVTLVVTVVARTSSGGGRGELYRVRGGDTLWSIAVAHYGGDPREAVWRIQKRNGLVNALLRPGQRLVLP